MKLLSLMLVAAMTLSACQGGAVTNETATIDAGEVIAEAIEEPAVEVETKTETEAMAEETVANEGDKPVVETVTESKETNNSTETSTEEVAKFPVRNEKIPPYEIAVRDGSTIKLDQYEGKVVVLAFFTTW